MTEDQRREGLITEALLILAASCTSLAEGIVIRRYNTRYRDGGFLFVALISVFSLIYFLITDTNGFSAPLELWLLGTLSGVFYCTASFLTYLALQCGPFAQTNLILSYSVVLSVGYGIFFLHEPLSKMTLPGIAVILISLYMINPGTKSKAPTEANRISVKWLIFIGLSTVGCGMVGVLQKMQQIHFENACNHEFMIITLSFSAVMLAVVGFRQERGRISQILRSGLPFAACAGTANGVTNFLSMLINNLMPLTLATPLRTGTKIVLSFVCSRLLFREDFNLRQIVGIVLGTFGLILLNL